MKFDERRLVVVSGPSGCGKDTVVKEVINKNPVLWQSVSCTSRPMREYEVEGEHYYFVSREMFELMIDSGEMLEYTEYAGNYYGTPVRAIEKKINEGRTVILVIEVRGAKKVKELFPGSLLVFIVPPSLEELERRLRIRNTEDAKERAKRMGIARAELKQMAHYDAIVENDVVGDCAERLMELVEDWQKKN